MNRKTHLFDRVLYLKNLAQKEYKIEDEELYSAFDKVLHRITQLEVHTQ